ncbi:MAG TPA: hypothetical protein VGA56_25715 [Opitutaceae bacterium]
MRKLFWQISVTLDGFMEGPNGELDTTAQFADPDFDRYASAMLQSIDDIVLGEGRGHVLPFTFLTCAERRVGHGDGRWRGNIVWRIPGLSTM